MDRDGHGALTADDPLKAVPLWRAVIGNALLQALLVGLLALAMRVVLTQWPTSLPERIYAGPILCVGAATMRYAGVSLVVALAIGVALKLRGCSWRDEQLRPLRVIVASIAIVLAWSYGLYPYNHYFGQAHLLDRGLVIALALLTIRHPSFFPPFLWMVIVVIGQFKGTIGYYSWTDISLVVDGAAIMTAGLALRALGLVRAQAIVLALLVMVAAQYFDAARLKVTMSPTGFEWVFHNDMASLFVSSHLNGWLPDLSTKTVLTLASAISLVAVPLQLLTLVIEGAPIVMLLSRRLTIGVLAALIAIHVGIFAASGILFWKWAALCAALAWTLRRFGKGWLEPRWLALAVLPIIFYAGKIPSFGNGLAWWDTRLSQYHELVAVTDTGERFRLDEHDLAPYDKTIAQDRFTFLHKEKRLTRTLAAVDRPAYPLFRALQDAQTDDAVAAMIEQQGTRQWDRTKAQRFDDFIRIFLRSRNEHGKELLVRFFALVSPPMHIGHRAPTATRLPPDAKVARVEVMFREVFFDGERLHELSERKVRTIDIDIDKEATVGVKR